MTDEAKRVESDETTEIARFDDPFSGAVTRLVNWPEGLVLWHGGEIVWRSWGPKAARPDRARLSPGEPSGEGRLVAGPSWCCEGQGEDGEDVWQSEVQTVGGYAVVASVWGATKAEAEARRDAILAALTPPASSPAPVADGVEPVAWREVREAVVLAISFLNRDVGTDRATKTIDQLLPRLVRAEQAIRDLDNSHPKAWYIESRASPGECWELIEGREPTEYLGDESFTVTALYTRPPEAAVEIEALRARVGVLEVALERAANWLDDLAEVVGSGGARSGSARRWKHDTVKDWARRTRVAATPNAARQALQQREAG